MVFSISSPVSGSISVTMEVLSAVLFLARYASIWVSCFEYMVSSLSFTHAVTAVQRIMSANMSFLIFIFRHVYVCVLPDVFFHFADRHEQLASGRILMPASVEEKSCATVCGGAVLRPYGYPDF